MNVEPHRFFKSKPARLSGPPGGPTSDIFGSSEDIVQQSPKRTPKNHQKSSIFEGSEESVRRKTSSPRHAENKASAGRLFGGEEEAKMSPRRMNDTWKSTLFEPVDPVANGGGKGTPEKMAEIPANGHLNGHNGHTNGHSATNGSTNGHSNGVNGVDH